MVSICDLPPELVAIIAEYLAGDIERADMGYVREGSSKQKMEEYRAVVEDLMSMSLVCQKFRPLAQEHLCSSVFITNHHKDQMYLLLRTLLEKPNYQTKLRVLCIEELDTVSIHRCSMRHWLAFPNDFLKTPAGSVYAQAIDEAPFSEFRKKVWKSGVVNHKTLSGAFGGLLLRFATNLTTLRVNRKGMYNAGPLRTLFGDQTQPCTQQWPVFDPARTLSLNGLNQVISTNLVSLNLDLDMHFEAYGLRFMPTLRNLDLTMRYDYDCHVDLVIPHPPIDEADVQHITNLRINCMYRNMDSVYILWADHLIQPIVAGFKNLKGLILYAEEDYNVHETDRERLLRLQGQATTENEWDEASWNLSVYGDNICDKDYGYLLRVIPGDAAGLETLALPGAFWSIISDVPMPPAQDLQRLHDLKRLIAPTAALLGTVPPATFRTLPSPVEILPRGLEYLEIFEADLDVCGWLKDIVANKHYFPRLKEIVVRTGEDHDKMQCYCYRELGQIRFAEYAKEGDICIRLVCR